MDERKETTPDQNDGGADRSGWQRARWIAAFIVALLAVAYYLHGIQGQVVCHEALSAGKAIKLCGPPGLSELVPFVLVIAVLLAPDLTELAIPGLLSLKRTVSRQESRQDQVEEKLTRIEQRVEQRVQQNTTQQVLIGTEKYVELKGETFQKAEGEIEEKEEPAAEPGEELEEYIEGGTEGEVEAEVATEEGDRQTATEPPGLVSDEDDERASLTLQLAWLTKNLTQYETISRMRRVDQGGQQMAGLTEEQQETIDRWYNVFEDEIGLVKQFRNTLIHDPYAVEIYELREAVRIGRRLMRILLNGIGLSTKALDTYGEPKEPGSPA